MSLKTAEAACLKITENTFNELTEGHLKLH